MSIKLSNLLDLASTLIPAVGALAKSEEGGKFAEDIVEVIKMIVKEEDPNKAKAALEADPALEEEVKKRLAELTDKKAEEENWAREQEERKGLDDFQKKLDEQSENHQRELELIQRDLDSVNAARVHAQKAMTSDGWTAWINPLLSIFITLAFLFFVFFIAGYDLSSVFDENGDISTNKSANNKEVFLVAFGALATAFVTVITFHFGSSSGSKRKTQLQRIYGTKGTISARAIPTANKHEAKAKEAVKKAQSQGARHPFEAFWQNNLSHIKHFNWEELLYKGASNARFKSNTDPDPSLYTNVVPLVNILEKIRLEIGAPVKLISVYRNPTYNGQVGGASSSRHMRFDAADFKALGPTAGTADDWHKIAKKLRSNGEFTGGIGVYKSFVHIDMRGKNADWDQR